MVRYRSELYATERVAVLVVSIVMTTSVVIASVIVMVPTSFEVGVAVAGVTVTRTGRVSA